MRILGVLMFIASTLCAQAYGVSGSNYGVNPMMNMGNGYTGYGPQIGENMVGSTNFLSCACATRIKLSREKEDPTCDNYSRMHQNMIINPGAQIQGVAPANPQHIMNMNSGRLGL